MTAMALPFDIAALVIDVVRRRHPEHLALLERERGLPAQVLPHLQTIDHLAGEGFRLKNDSPPACLVGVFGNADPPQRDRTLAYNLTWSMVVEVTMAGRNRADTLLARDYLAMTVTECILDRVPRDGHPITALSLDDVDLTPSIDEVTQQTVGQARMLFTVEVVDAIGRSGLPADNTALEAGSPGGPPADPYTPAVPWPLATDVQHEAEREPIQ